MNREDIIRMAREAGCVGPGQGGDPNGLWEPNGHENVTALMVRFAALVVAAERDRIITENAPEIERINAHINALEEAVAAERDRCYEFIGVLVEAEREACAKVCEAKRMVKGGEVFAAAIRARGEA